MQANMAITPARPVPHQLARMADTGRGEDVDVFALFDAFTHPAG